LSAKARLKSLARRRREESLVVLFDLWKNKEDQTCSQVQQEGHRYWHYMRYLDLSNLRLVGQYYHTSMPADASDKDYVKQKIYLFSSNLKTFQMERQLRRS
jgi:hypothetical protein